MITILHSDIFPKALTTNPIGRNAVRWFMLLYFLEKKYIISIVAPLWQFTFEIVAIRRTKSAYANLTARICGQILAEQFNIVKLL